MEDPRANPEVMLGALTEMRLQLLTAALGRCGLVLADGPDGPERVLSRLAIWHQSVGGSDVHPTEEQVVNAMLHGGAEEAELGALMDGVVGWLGANKPANTVAFAPLGASAGHAGKPPDTIERQPEPDTAEADTWAASWLPQIDQDEITSTVARIRSHRSTEPWLTANLSNLCARLGGVEPQTLAAMDESRLPQLLICIFEVYWTNDRRIWDETFSQRQLTYQALAGYLLVHNDPRGGEIKRAAQSGGTMRRHAIAFGRRSTDVVVTLHKMNADRKAHVARRMGWQPVKTDHADPASTVPAETTDAAAHVEQVPPTTTPPDSQVAPVQTGGADQSGVIGHGDIDVEHLRRLLPPTRPV